MKEKNSRTRSRSFLSVIAIRCNFVVIPPLPSPQASEEKIDPRKQFESELDAATQWVHKADHFAGVEMRGTVNIATLDEQLAKFKALRKEEEETRAALTALVAQANEAIMPTLADADRLTLQSQMDELCDKMNQGRERRKTQSVCFPKLAKKNEVKLER